MIYKKLRGLLTSPLACFLLYIGVIIIFAVFYCLLPNQFYHMNIIREREFNELEDIVKEQFKQTLLLNLKNEAHKNYVSVDKENKYRLKVDSITVDSYSCEDSSYDITVHVLDRSTYEYNDYFAFMEFTISYNVKLIGTRILMGDESVLQTAKVEQTNRLYDAIKSVESDELIDISNCFKGENWNFVVKISKDLYENMEKMSEAHNGYASYVENNFFRMLYLSMVTITTLGYGDIVPITDMARIVIGIEAFLGVMVSGLFINALFQRTIMEKKE